MESNKNEIMDKLFDAGFSKVESTEDGGYHVEKNYNSMLVYADVSKSGEVISGTKASALAWVIGILTFPLGAFCVWLYMNTRKTERINEVVNKVRRATRKN